VVKRRRQGGSVGLQGLRPAQRMVVEMRHADLCERAEIEAGRVEGARNGASPGSEVEISDSAARWQRWYWPSWPKGVSIKGGQP